MPFEGGSNSTFTKDYSGHGFNGLPGNSSNPDGDTKPTRCIDCGKIGGAYVFDGVDDYINVTDIELTNNFSISFWMKFTSFSETTWILSQRNNTGSSNSSGIEIKLVETANEIKFNILTCKPGGSLGSGYGDNLTLNTWYHAVVVFYDVDTPMDELVLFVDGVPKESDLGTNMSSFEPSLTELLIGSGKYWDYDDLNGTIDELKIFNRSLTNDQIYQMYLEENQSINAHTIISTETELGDEWNCEVTPNDGYEDGNTLNSSEVTITDTVSPQWSDNKTSPSSPATYSPGQSYQFNVTWIDDNLDTIQIEHNLTGSSSPHNDSFSGNEGNEYYFDVSDLAVGTYVWRSFADDTSNNENVTDEGNYWTFIVNKAKPALILSNSTASVNTSDLVGYWRLEEGSSNPIDYSGYDNDGSSLGNGLDCSGNTGRFSNACEFDGLDDHFNISDNPSLEGMSEFSISIWIYPHDDENSGGTGYARILVKENGYLMGIWSGDDFRFEVYNSSGDSIENTFSNFGDTDPWDKWYNFVAITNSSGFYIYKNGVFWTSYATSNFDYVNMNSGDLVIGRSGTSSSYAYNGTIDELMIFNRSLSADEIAEFYESRVTYGTSVTFTGSDANQADSDVTYELFRNTTDVTATENGTATTLGGGYHYYLFNTSGGENYTRSAILIPLNITKASSTINLLLNDTDGDKIYDVNQLINSSIELVTPGMSTTVYLDTNITGWTVDSGNSPYENFTSISTVGTYNFTGYWPGNENYTSSSETHYVTINQPGYLEVSLVDPPSSLSVTQNQTFTVNATVYCRDGTCGIVQGIVQYNGSSQNPDTSVNTTTGDKPFYTQDTPQVALKSCPTNPLDNGEYCNLTWTINATGAINSEWELGVLFNSSASGLDDNHTNNSTITITTCSCDITLWSPATITFSSTLNPSTNQNEAQGNSNDLYNITVNQGSCTSDIWIRGQDLTNSTYGTTILIGNFTWSNTSNEYISSYNMTTEYTPVKDAVGELTNVTTYYWLNVPPVLAGRYRGNITILANQTQ
jgi:hypothetical protein